MAKASSLSFATWAVASGFSGYGATVKVSGDTLEVVPTTSYPTLISTNLFDLTESFFSVELLQAPNRGTGSISADLLVVLDGNNQMGFGYSDGSLRVALRVGGAATYHAFTPYNPAVHRYLRIREAAAQLHAETSPDGVEWVALYSRATPFAVTAIQLMIQAGHWQAEADPGTAVFGAVNTFAAPPPPLDWGPNTGIAFGAFATGSPPSTTQFQEVVTATGRTPTYVLWFANFTGFTLSSLRAVDAMGAINYLTWEASDGTVLPATYNYAAILAGNHNAAIDAAAARIATFGKLVYLRPFHEMNGDWYPWGIGVHGNTAAQHVQAWRYLRDRFAAAGATNVRWVWSPNHVTPALPYAGFYPGDDVVDVVAVDGYNFGGEGWSTAPQIWEQSFAQLRALNITRPYWLGETASAEVGGDKATWITEFFQWMTNQPELTAFHWFHVNKERDWRITSSPAAADAFTAALSHLDLTAEAGPSRTVEPWSAVTLTGTGAAAWSQVSGTPVTLTGAGATVTFTAPAAMTPQALVFAYGADETTVTVTAADHGIKTAAGVVPFRFSAKA